MNEKDLTYEEQYEVPIELLLESFSVEYGGCGSHQMKITAVTKLSNLQELYQRLKEIKGIDI